jgi:hypothetical protein
MLILSINLNLTSGSYYDPPSKKHQIWGYPEVVDELINIKKVGSKFPSSNEWVWCCKKDKPSKTERRTF